MKASGFVTLACAGMMAASAPLAAAQQATEDKPVMCWDYTTLADGAGSRFGLKGAVDDTILSRAAYYVINKVKAKVVSPMAAGTTTWFKVELRGDAAGAVDPVALSGLLVELENPLFAPVVPGIRFEVHTDAQGRTHRLTLVAFEARFKAGDEVVSVPFRSQGPDLRRQDIALRLGAYPHPTWPVGQQAPFDPTATLPVVKQIDAAWRKAGTLTIELVLGEGGAVVATSEPLSYPGDKAAAEFVRMNARAPEMISGGVCQP